MYTEFLELLDFNILYFIPLMEKLVLTMWSCTIQSANSDVTLNELFIYLKINEQDAKRVVRHYGTPGHQKSTFGSLLLFHQAVNVRFNTNPVSNRNLNTTVKSCLIYLQHYIIMIFSQSDAIMAFL